MKWMDRERSFWVIGGDLRQRALARLLREDGHTVHIAGLEGEGLEPEPLGPGLALAHCVILPLPVAVGESFVHTPLSAARLPLAQVLDCLRPAGLRRYDFPGGGGGDDPAGSALGGLLRQGRVHGGQRCAHGGGGGAGGHGGAAHHAPQRQGPHPGLRPGGKAHRPPDGGLGGEGHGLGPVL